MNEDLSGPKPSRRPGGGRGSRLGVAWVLAGLLALPVFSASAGGRHGGPHGMRGIEHRVEALELDAEVRERVDTILDAARDEGRELRGELRAAHQRMRSLLEQDAPDEEAVLAQADVIGALHTQAHKQHLSVLLQLHPLLSQEQREQLRHRPEHRDKRGDRSLR